MDHVPIAELKPELPALDSAQIRGVVTLIWPYSSSARQFALLLGDPDFRLRRKKGQVRVRFSGSSSRAIANTGVGIGDEVVLSLRGAEFVRDGSVSTPGKSIDWELSYEQTVSARIQRDGAILADLDLTDVAPTPAPGSPTRCPPRSSAPTDASLQWSSPAFLKRVRLSDGPVLRPPYDPFVDDIEDGHAAKRRRRSYRDWASWTYLARTPSSGKEDVDMEVDEVIDQSPIRATHLPKTPVSPTKPAAVPTAISHASLHDESDSDVDNALEGEEVSEESDQDELGNSPEADVSVHDFAQDADHDLYPGPDEEPTPDTHTIAQDDSESSESDVEVFEAPDVHHPEHTSSDTGIVVDQPPESEPSQILEILSDHTESEEEALSAAHPEEKQGSANTEVTEMAEVAHNASTNDSSRLSPEEQSEALSSSQVPPEVSVESVVPECAPRLIMPPPTLPLLQTDFQTSFAPGMLTPIGKEPSSPSLRPLDSATLPMPSPLPGERDGVVTSFLDYVSSTQLLDHHADVEAEIPEDEPDYIMESSFYSSISSSRAPAFQPSHESAFTDLRFTFGMDGASLSRPRVLAEQDLFTGNHNTFPDAKRTEGAPNSTTNQQSSPIHFEESVVESDEPVVDLDKSAVELDEPVVEHDEPVVEVEEPLVELELDEPVVELDEPVVELDEPVQELDKPSSESEGSHHEPQSSQQDEDSDKSSGQSPQSNIERDQLEEQPSVVLQPGDEYQMSDTEARDDDQPTLDIHSDEAHSHPVAQDESMIDLSNDIHETSESSEHVGLTAGNIAQSHAGPEVIDLGSSSDDSETDEEIEEHEEHSKRDMDQSTTGSPGLFGDTLIQQDEQPSDLEHFAAVGVLEDQLAAADDAQNTPSNEIGSHSNQIKQESFESTNLFGDFSHDFLPDSHSPQHDMKMESIEEHFPALHKHRNAHDHLDEESDTEYASELLIAVPEEGHKVGELHYISVPDSAPARNTRSKTKTSASPGSEGNFAIPASRPYRRRSGRTRTTESPAASRSTYTASPTQETFSASPYSLRSQSKQLTSPTKSIVPTARESINHQSATQATSSAEPASQRMSLSQASYLTDAYELSQNMFQPSQELGMSRGKFTNVSYVKDSEEDSLHSENSLSTNQSSDDWTTNVESGREGATARVRDLSLTPKKNDSANAMHSPSPSTPTQVSFTDYRGEEQAKSSSPEANRSPVRRRGSIIPIDLTSSSPRRSPRINKKLPVIDTDMAGTGHANESESTDHIAYPVLRTVNEEQNEMPSSPPAHVSPKHHADQEASDAGRAQEASANLQAIVDSHLPITPEQSQQRPDSQPSFPAAQEQNLPMTPLTQTTFAGTQSFEANGANTNRFASDTLVEPVSVTEIATRRSPRHTRKTSDTKLLNEQSTHSDPPMPTKEEPPSIGLSTPIAYYTPLKDLPFFLNRSSTFHSSGSPDILALVTTATTPPTRATKGPKHHNTTLHITDLSTYPSQTTVQIFRAYATALPVAAPGDIVLLRAFSVRSLNRHPCLVSADESAWCVWRYGKPLWGKKKGVFAEVKAREEVKGPEVERGEGEWREVVRLREWWVSKVKVELEEHEHMTRSKDTKVEGEDNRDEALGSQP